MGESEPSVTVPRTSPPAIVWCCETPVLKNLDERSERDKRELRQGPTWTIQHQRAYQTRVRTLAAGPRSAWGRTMPGRESVVRSRIVTIRHTTSYFGDFGGPFPREPGWTSRKKVPLGVRLKPTRRSHTKHFLAHKCPRSKATKPRRGVCGVWQYPNTGQIYLFCSSVFGGSSAAPFALFLIYGLRCAAQRRVLRAFYVFAHLHGSWGICQRLWENTPKKWNSQANSAARRNGITSAPRALNSRCRCR